MNLQNVRQRLFRSTSISAILLRRAAMLTLLFLVLHLFGFRDHVSVLSGTGPSSPAYRIAGALYIAAYFSLVVLVPVLLIAAALSAGIRIIAVRKTASNQLDERE